MLGCYLIYWHNSTTGLPMNEKRTANRIKINHPVTLRVEDDPVEGVLFDLSRVGALFIVDGAEQEKLDPEVLGLEASFVIKPKGKAARRYMGEIVRFYLRDGKTHVALRFWRPFEELSGS
jgi:hypothetical protein